jgi:hypothetical protein
MSLRALRKHRYVPAAVALMSVMLYTALITSHIVSQATHQFLPAPEADTHNVIAGELGCHDALPSAGKKGEPSRGHPTAPPTKCPFCTGYAGLHISLATDSVNILPLAFAQLLASCGGAQLVGSVNLPFWHSRAPPTLS